MINAGTNDLRGKGDVPTQHIRMRNLITDLWDNISPDTVIVLSTLLVGNDANGERNRAIVNPRYRELVSEFHGHGRPIYLADMDPNEDGWGYITMDDMVASENPKIHPNVSFCLLGNLRFGETCIDTIDHRIMVISKWRPSFTKRSL